MPHHPSISHTTPKEPNLRQEYEEGLSPHSKLKASEANRRGGYFRARDIFHLQSVVRVFHILSSRFGN